MNLVVNILRRFHIGLSLLAVLAVLYDLGFTHATRQDFWLNLIYSITLAAAVISAISRYFNRQTHPKPEVMLFDLASAALFLVLFLEFSTNISIPVISVIFHDEGWRIAAMFLVFIREVTSLKIIFKRTILNPAQLFVVSFITLILLGTFVLMLPRATQNGISLINALFTSTSAVCVTGLAVVDTGTYFTHFGQLVLLVFIQLGGLGIMTFASYFSYFFQGGASYENQLALSDMTNSEKLGEVFVALKRIILITFIIEATGAVFIMFTLDHDVITDYSSRIFFAIFHSVSGFCNAGFSTLSGSMYEPAFKLNYPLHLILAWLYIIGGMGFPIVFNLVNYIKHIVAKWFNKLFKGSGAYSKPWVVNLNTRIVLLTSLILIVAGTILMFFIEYDNTLREHSFFGKIVTAFFNATTTRTAGFNSVDMSQMYMPTIMIFILLMWIGASPASTGGGIKTSTIAIATLNFLSIAQGKDRIEIYRREISDISVRRAFSIISLSLIIIGLAISIMVSLEPHLGLKDIAFECFSAYSTVGLSLGITAGLSSASKLILIVVMFIGRVSMLSILIAIMKQTPYKNYRYPTENIMIN